MATWEIASDWCGPVQSPAEVLKESLGSEQNLLIRTGEEADGNTDTGSGHSRGGEAGGVRESSWLLEPLPWGCGSWLCVQEASGSERPLMVHYQQRVLIRVVNSSKEATINI